MITTKNLILATLRIIPAILIAWLGASLAGSYGDVSSDGSVTLRSVAFWTAGVFLFLFLFWKTSTLKYAFVLMVIALASFFYYYFVAHAVTHWGYRTSQQDGLETLVLMFLFSGVCLLVSAILFGLFLAKKLVVQYSHAILFSLIPLGVLAFAFKFIWTAMGPILAPPYVLTEDLQSAVLVAAQVSLFCLFICVILGGMITSWLLQPKNIVKTAEAAI